MRAACAQSDRLQCRGFVLCVVVADPSLRGALGKIVVTLLWERYYDMYFKRSVLLTCLVSPLLMLTPVSVARGADQSENSGPRPIIERLLPSPKNAGFRMEGFFVWGGVGHQGGQDVSSVCLALA